MRRFARVIIKDALGRMLVLRHRHDQWNFPGGKVNPGESFAAAAVRETYEEVGIRVTSLRELMIRRFVIDGQMWEGAFYFAECIDGVPERREPLKAREVAFKFANELESLSALREVLADVANASVVWRLDQSVRSGRTPKALVR